MHVTQKQNFCKGLFKLVFTCLSIRFNVVLREHHTPNAQLIALPSRKHGVNIVSSRYTNSKCIRARHSTWRVAKTKKSFFFVGTALSSMTGDPQFGFGDYERDLLPMLGTLVVEETVVVEVVRTRKCHHSSA